MNHHLSDKQIAERLASDEDNGDRSPEITEHLSKCADCRSRLDRAAAMLDMAAAVLEPAEPIGDCPAADRMAAFLDNRLDGDDADSVMRHIAACADCTDVVKWTSAAERHEPRSHASTGNGSRGSKLRLWISGGVLLAAACVAMVFVYAGAGPIDLSVRVFSPGATRSTSSSTDVTEFEVGVRVEHPAWVTLLVVDAGGDLTCLAERHIEASATFGRYATRSPGAESHRLLRRYVILLVSQTSLSEKLAKTDVETVRLGPDFEANAGALEKLCSRLRNLFDCRAQFAPIDSSAPRP